MIDLGAKEILIIAGIVVLLFGSKKIPEVAKNIGTAIRQITGAVSDVKNEVARLPDKKK